MGDRRRALNTEGVLACTDARRGDSAADERRSERRLPTTLFGRSLLIIVLPVALMQIAASMVRDQ